MLVFCIFQFVSCGFLLNIDIVILNMLSDMFCTEILYMKCMNFEFEIVAFALSNRIWMQIGLVVIDFVIYVCEYCLLWVPNFKSAMICYIDVFVWFLEILSWLP